MPLLEGVQVVLRFGSLPTSAALAGFLDRINPVHRVHIVEHGVWQDDSHRTSLFLQADPALTCRALLSRLPGGRDNGWSLTILEIERRYWETLETELHSGSFTEGAAVAEALAQLRDGDRLFVGNSLPVRHLDAYGRPSARRIQVFGSRGASGIDGNLSTAFGIAAADPERLLVAVIGDITFYHDMNGLYALQKHGLKNVLLLLLNNNGGGIFRRLPVSRLEPPFEELFLTPHGLDFGPAAEMYGLEYRPVQDRESLQKALSESLVSQNLGGPALIELQTDSQKDLRRHREIMGVVVEAIANLENEKTIEGK